MYVNRAVADSATRWDRFCRRGRHLAVGFAALWFGSLVLLFGLAPAPAPLPHAPPMPVSWWPAAEAPALDIRALWSPALFALPSPAGFTHALRQERVRLAPPIQALRPEPAYLPRASVSVENSQTAMSRFTLPSATGVGRLAPDSGVLPPRHPESETDRMLFSAGWESRLLAGIDLEYGSWTNVAWSARVEMRFDPQGVPVSMLLEQASGLPEVDGRLARSVRGWRLLDPNAPRMGMVSWIIPAGPIAPATSALSGSGQVTP